MKKTQNELELISLREKRFKEIKVWSPSSQELEKLILSIWEDVLTQRKYLLLLFQIDLVIQPTFKQRYYRSDNDKVFGRYVGKPEGDSVIFLYYQDVLEINMYQENLFVDHVWYILDHELEHYFGHTHEDMEKINDFKYPGAK